MTRITSEKSVFCVEQKECGNSSAWHCRRPRRHYMRNVLCGAGLKLRDFDYILTAHESFWVPSAPHMRVCIIIIYYVKKDFWIYF